MARLKNKFSDAGIGRGSMRGNWARAVVIAGVCAMLAAVAGCSATEGVPNADLSTLKRVTQKLLSPQEKEAMIRDLALEQKQRREEAEKEIERR